MGGAKTDGSRVEKHVALSTSTSRQLDCQIPEAALEEFVSFARAEKGS